MALIEIPPIKPGDAIVDMSKGKIYEDYKARPGEKALITMHTVPFEGSVGLINMLTATRLIRKGYDLTLLLYGPGVLMASATRGFPTAGEEGFAGNLAFNKQLNTIMKEGGKIVACRFAMSALYGMREADLLPGVKAIHPLDVLDCILEHQRSGSLILATWTV
jgi:uncharacterized repeat protein (TIGR04044 family)